MPTAGAAPCMCCSVGRLRSCACAAAIGLFARAAHLLAEALGLAIMVHCLGVAVRLAQACALQCRMRERRGWRGGPGLLQVRRWRPWRPGLVPRPVLLRARVRAFSWLRFFIRLAPHTRQQTWGGLAVLAPSRRACGRGPQSDRAAPTSPDGLASWLVSPGGGGSGRRAMGATASGVTQSAGSVFGWGALVDEQGCRQACSARR